MLLISLAGCSRYDIEWRDFSNDNNIEISLSFWNGINVKNITLQTLRDKYFYIPNNYEYRGCEYPGEVNIFIYPRFNKMEWSGKIEIYVYNYEVTEKSENSITLVKRDNVVAYYADFYRNDTIFTVISKDQIITATNPKKKQHIVNMLQESMLSDYTYSVENNTANIEKTNVGYIVKSKLDDTFFFLGNESRGIDLPVIRKE